MKFEIKKEMNEGKEMGVIKFLKPLSFSVEGNTIEDIIKAHKKHMTSMNHILFNTKQDNIINVLNFNGSILTLIFIEPIKVTYKNILYEEEFIDLIDQQVYSLKQIDYFLDNFKIKKASFINNINNQRCDYFMFKFLISNKEIIIINHQKYYKFEKSIYTIFGRETFGKYELSRYFDKYFTFPDNKQDFKFFSTDNRKDLIYNLNSLVTVKTINKFKISGPSGEGKSITLLYFSRMFFNIIYLNLKVLHKLYDESKIEDYQELLMYEFGRLSFEKNNKQQKFEKLFNDNADKELWTLLMLLFDFLKEESVTIIFDQYKSKYISQIHFNKIKDMLSSTFKIIISSSINDAINDGEIGKQVAESLYKNKGNPEYLNEKTQNDYFYYSNLINYEEYKNFFRDNDKNKNEKYEFFNYEPKYIKYIEDKKTNKDIQDHIIEKMSKHSNELGIELDFYIFNIYSRIDKESKYEILPLKTISLKYTRLIIKPNAFVVQYKFKFVKNLVENYIKNIDVKDYFEKEKYKEKDLYCKLKGDFFEYSSIINMNIFPYNIDYCLTVDSIIDMKNYGNKNDLEELIQNNKNGTIHQIKVKELITKDINIIDDEINKINNNKEFQVNCEENNINTIYFKELQAEKIKLNNILLGKKRDVHKTDITNIGKYIQKEKIININKSNIEKIINLEESVDYIEYNEVFKNGTILIKQKKLNGEALDLGILFGKKSEKEFLGFQMKFYAETTYLSHPITKNSIKKKIKSILINCLKNFGISIKKWHYVMCLYWDKYDNINYCKQLVKNCKNHDIKYIFYNPKLNQFYKPNKDPLTILNVDMQTNIDFYSLYNPYHFFVDTNYIEGYLNQSRNKSSVMVEPTDINKEIWAKIRKCLTLKNNNIKLICKFKLEKKSPFPLPKQFHLLLFKLENDNLLIYNIDKNIHCKKINTHEDIYPAFISNYLGGIEELRDKDIYFYVFEILKE